MKRYQNPEVFEPLAMAYALGTLQGKARQRFKTLMSQYFYLRVVTEAYEHQFSGLVGLLTPEEPSPEVWKRLEAELNLTQQQKPKKRSALYSWLDWFHVPAMALASVLTAVITLFILNNTQPDAYFAELSSSARQSIAMASVSKKDMQITIAMADTLLLGEGVTPTLWCLSKTPGEAPIRMGKLNAQGKSQLSINEETWNGLKEVGHFAITLEPVDSASKGANPSGEMLLIGELMSGTE